MKTNDLLIPISLDENDFTCLVRGGVLTIKDEEITIMVCLKDIGFHRMDEAISKAEKGIDIYKNLERKSQ